MSSNNINEYEFSNFSQNGEDGIIEFLSSKISNNDKYFVEIGCGNGLENNSTNLVLNNWSGVVCDKPSNIHLYKRLIKIIQPKKEIKRVSAMINLKNIKELTHIIKIKNKEITFLSLDIDSYDFFIMLELLKNNILPKIICVEYNPFFGKEPLTVLYKPNSKGFYFHKERLLYYGASLKAWKVLFKRYNYEFICVEKNGVNAFFILPQYFNKRISEYTGLQFSYTNLWIDKLETNGKTLENRVLKKFKNELININELL